MLLEAVLQFLRLGCFRHIQHAEARRHVNAVAQRQILGHQRFQEDHAAVAVGQSVEKFRCDAVFVVKHPEGAGPQLLPVHMHHGVGAVLPHPGRRRDLLQIVPEGPPAQPDGNGREPGQNLFHRRLKNFRVHRLRQLGGNPEHVVPVPAHDGGKDGRGVVQPHPFQFSGHASTSRQKATMASMSQRRSLRQ